METQAKVTPPEAALVARAREGVALLLDADEAAALIGVSRATFWKLHSQGKVPLPVRLSARVVRWPKHELEHWVRSGCPARDKCKSA